MKTVEDIWYETCKNLGFFVSKRVKVLIDLFIQEVPFIMVGRYQIVEPKFLLTLYETTHSSKNCTAVRNATMLVRKGTDPVGRPELIGQKPSKW
jgi:hypothetical protein